MNFICNVCGDPVENMVVEDLDREGGACPRCGSTVRMRSMVHLLSLSLFDRSLPISEWPKRRNIVGIGVSDWHKFSGFLKEKVYYRNTQYDRHPFLDVTKPQFIYRCSADFIMCSDVLEHVNPPVQAAFNGLYSMLKPGGALIFSVPWGFGATGEHFPELHDWKLEKDGDHYTLVNTTISGKQQIFTDLHFHGGRGQVLEMRLFGLEDLKRHFETAGFTGLRILQEDVLAYGIKFKHPWGLPMVARRPSDRSAQTMIFSLIHAIYPKRLCNVCSDFLARARRYLSRKLKG